MWPENDLHVSYKFDFQGRIYLTIENAFFACFHDFDFQGRIYLKNETRIFITNRQISGPAHGVPKSSQVGSKWLDGGPTGSPERPKSSTRGLEDTDSIYSNSRSTAKRPLYIHFPIGKHRAKAGPSSSRAMKPNHLLIGKVWAEVRGRPE